MYGWYGLIPGEQIRVTKKEHKRTISKMVKVIKEYPYFILVEVKGRISNYQITINKSWICCKEATIESV